MNKKRMLGISLGLLSLLTFTACNKDNGGNTKIG